jgi:nitroimidazol reductase NimA-like FMN-containing flavoprotein (pyridoxamine 5'-phosphate oxidase superfamily)
MAAELADVARSVIDANSYMALGTADGAGNPWVSPVWFASEDYRNFHWVSSPDAKHSRNLAAHPEVAIAIFDSSVPVGSAQAVYMKGVAKELTGAELEQVWRSLTAWPVGTSVAGLDRAWTG